MNICYCFDSRYKNLSLESFKTVQTHNPDARLLTIEEDKKHLLDFLPSTLIGSKYLTRAVFLRLLIPLAFPQMDRVLYLDGDIVCKGNLHGLYDMDFEGNYFIACRGPDASLKQQRELGLPWYVNSGVILFNIPLLLRDNYLAQIQENWTGFIGKPEHYSADETVLNWVFHNKIKLAEQKYNYCYFRRYRRRDINPCEVINWHIIGNDKNAVKLLSHKDVNLKFYRAKFKVHRIKLCVRRKIKRWQARFISLLSR